MKKIYNSILVILIICAIVVGMLIFNKYYNEAKNEKELSNIQKEVEKNIKEQNEIETTYKGYKIVGIIEIPKINIKYPILSQTTEKSLLISVTKFWGPDINTVGNITIAGHNNFSGTMFGKIKKLEEGDIIKLTDLNNETMEYKVFQKYKINPNDVTCVESVEDETKEVTLITCTNGHKERQVVKAREIK